jgi:hypothetical protein
MATPLQSGDLVAVADEFRATLGALGLAQHRVARLFGVGPRSVRRWKDGDRRVPCGVSIVIRLLAAGAVTIAEVEQAAVPVPAQTNDSARPEPLTQARSQIDQSDDIHAPDDRSSPVTVMAVTEAHIDDTSPVIAEPGAIPENRATPTSEPIAILDRSQHDISASVGSADAATLATAEQVRALTPAACRWPCGDPGQPDFHFCSALAIEKPYCEHHRVMAHVAPRTGGGHGAGIGPVAQERQSRLQQAHTPGRAALARAFFRWRFIRQNSCLISLAASAHSRPLERAHHPSLCSSTMPKTAPHVDLDIAPVALSI